MNMNMMQKKRRTHTHMRKDKKKIESDENGNDFIYKSKERIESEWRMKIEDSFEEKKYSL